MNKLFKQCIVLVGIYTLILLPLYLAKACYSEPQVDLPEELIPALKAKMQDGDSTPYLMEVRLENDTLKIEFNNFYN
jgi:hypothetical protein